MKISRELELQRVRLNKGRSAEYGIYYLLDEDSNVVFINYSKSGIRRIFDHLKGPEETKRQFTHYVWVGMPGEIEINLVELVRQEIAVYEPLYNKPEVKKGVIISPDGIDHYYSLAAYARLLNVKYHIVRDAIHDLRHCDPNGINQVKWFRQIRKYYHIDDLNAVVKPMLSISKYFYYDNLTKKDRKKILFKPNPIRVIR